MIQSKISPEMWFISMEKKTSAETLHEQGNFTTQTFLDLNMRNIWDMRELILQMGGNRNEIAAPIQVAGVIL